MVGETERGVVGWKVWLAHWRGLWQSEGVPYLRLFVPAKTERPSWGSDS